MKNIFLSALFCLILVTHSEAQHSLGIKSGFNLSNVSYVRDHLWRQNDWPDGESTRRTGFNAGIFYRFTPFKNIPVFLQTEVKHAGKGYRYSIYEPSSQNTSSASVYYVPGGGTWVTSTYTYCPNCPDEREEIAFFQVATEYLEIPVLLGVTIKGETLNWHILAGPYFAYWLSGKVKSENMGIDNYKYKFSEVDNRKEYGYSFGIMIGIPVRKNELFASAFYNGGLTDIRNTDKLTYDKTAMDHNRNQCLQLSIGFMFNRHNQSDL